VTDAEGFFDDLTGEVDRDPSGDPLIMQSDGARLAYTRASGLGDFLMETEFLRRWEKRYLARQMGKNEDLAALAALETYSTGFDEDSVTKSASGKRLDSIIDRALDRGRIHERADYGTVIHALTEPGSEGYMPLRATVDVHAFWELVAINDIEILGTELFVVNDELKAAGTFDHLVRTKQHGVTIADKKNGRNIKGLGFSVQFATYAGAELYDPRTQERTGALSTLADGEEVNKDVALLFEVHDGMARVRTVDIARGREAARVAAMVRDMRKWASLANIDKSFKEVKASDSAMRERAIISRIEAAHHPEELRGIWYHYGQTDWSDAITEAAKAKKIREGWS
jgi:hypothetical protein